MLFCGSKQVKKSGHRDNGKQQYYCGSCKRQSIRGQRLNPNTLWQLYSDGKQTTAQLADQHECSLKTIRRHLAKAVMKANGVLPQAPVNLIVNTNFGRKWSVMVLYDAISRRALSVARSQERDD